ncbi:hypothetical protein DPMN_009419 [Dreissena polymorpha]|uniref:Uncharacterized protein n=1 Tax=Dreissena polymorpha TaxID=45954 RepID=A0A9D4MZK3_DREPO|nr:hypothetical protein DPMN_009419 [Dreissena polymorpha]
MEDKSREEKIRFQENTWNFWESGHGKRAPDGIGAVLKRQADTMVNTRGMDITKAADIVNGLAEMETTMKLSTKER